jgi:peptide/nickel transport system substrate-binding protein
MAKSIFYRNNTSIVLRISYIIQYVVVALIIVLASSCGGDGKTTSNNTFKFNMTSGVTSLDPAFARDQSNIWMVNAMFNGLLQFDELLNLQPCLAKSWTISEDALTYTFALRNDVYFHNDEVFGGNKRKLTAADVAYTFNRLIDPNTASPGAWIFNGRVAASNPFEALNDSTFVMRLKEPFGPMLSLLTLQYTYIVPKEATEKYGKEFRLHPVGTGPFMLKMWAEGNQLVMQKNPDYFEREGDQQLPYLDNVQVYFIQNKYSEYLEFNQGGLDFISSVDATTVNELLAADGGLKPEHNGKMTLYKIPYLNSEYLGFLLDEASPDANKALLNKKVRQAINYGFNRKEMLQYLRNNVGRPANAGFVPYGLPSFDEKATPGYNYDVAKAKQLLAEAGYPGGKGLPAIKLLTNPTYKDIAEYVQKQLAEIGINIDVEIMQPSLLRDQMLKGKATFFRGSWIADYPDAESFLSVFYGNVPAPPNYTRFRNAEFDSLYTLSLKETDQTKRFALYQALDRIVIEEAPIVPLYYDEVLRFVRTGVTGLEPNAMNLLDLKRVKVK